MNNLDYMNEAGERMCSMHKWRYLERVPAKLILVEDQDYVSLPVDVHTLIGPPIPTDTTLNNVKIVSMAEIERLRASGYSGLPYAACIEWSGNPPRARYAIVPTPDDTDEDAWHQPYRTGWSPLSTEDDVLPFPPYMRPLFNALCLAVKQGYEEHDNATVDDRVTKLMGGGTFISCVQRDAALQSRVTTLKAHMSFDETAVYTTGTVTGPQE